MPRNTKRVKGVPARSKPGKPSGPANPGKGQQGKGQQGQNQSNNGNSQKKGPAQANQRPIVPFLRKDRVLLIGEGEIFSCYFFFFSVLFFSI
jgi:25S rRNA (uracil2634-N3)-methyltransferase